MAPKTGANVGGKSVKKGRGRPRSRVGGNANAVNATNAVVNATNSGNVSGVNTMAPKTGANVGGRGRKSKKGGTPPVKPQGKVPVVPPSPAANNNNNNNAKAAAAAKTKTQQGGKSAKRGRGRPRKN